MNSQESDTNENVKFPTTQLFVLALCRIAEPVALTSVFPYAYDMMKHMGGTASKNAAFYAGIFIASFSLAETMTAFMWGSLSDRIGRKPVLLLGCVGTIISLLVMGFSTSMWLAILGRAFGGGLNGNIGVVQTMVGELVTNPKHEPRAYSIMPFFFAVGCTLGPTIGGYFARPEDSFPSTFGKLKILVRFPYLLPNLVCAAMVMVTIIIAIVFLEETHPSMPKQRERTDLQVNGSNDGTEEPLLGGRIGNADDNLSRITDGSCTTLEDPNFPTSLNSTIWNPIIAACLLTGHTLTYIQLFPIFLQTPPDTSVPKYYFGGIGGLGLPLPMTGQIMGIGGIISLVAQALVFPPCADYFGATNIFAFVTTLHPLTYFTAPYLAFTPPGVWRDICIYLWLTIRTIFSVFAFPPILIFVRRATPHNSMLGKVNGIVASSGAAFRTIAPPAAGLLQTFGENHHFSALAWWGSGIVALVGAVQGWIIVRQLWNRNDHV